MEGWAYSRRCIEALSRSRDTQVSQSCFIRLFDCKVSQHKNLFLCTLQLHSRMRLSQTNKKGGFINLAPIAICCYYVDESIFAAINKRKCEMLFKR